MQRRHTSAEIGQMRSIAKTMSGAKTEEWVRASIVAGMSVADMEECAKMMRQPTKIAALIETLLTTRKGSNL